MPYINVNDAYILDNTGKQVDDSVDYALANSNRNLLDNGWFTVREHGAGPFSGAVTCANRWTSPGAYTNIALLNPYGIKISNSAGNGATLDQVLGITGAELDGKTLTLSVLTDDGIVTGTGVFNTNGDGYKVLLTFGGGKWFARVAWYASVSTTHPFVRIARTTTTDAASINIYAVKLEIGAYSTLLNDIRPTYRTEAEKCHDYEYVVGAINGAQYVFNCYCVSPTGVFNAELLVQMNGTPQASFSGSGTVYTASGSFPITAINVSRSGANSMVIQVNVSGTPAAGQIGNVFFDNGAKLVLKVPL